MAPGVLYRVIYGSSKPEPWQEKMTTVRPAMLHDFRRHRVRYCDFPAIIPKTESIVRGTYVTGLSDGDIWRLDIFEGSMYERRKVKAKLLRDVRLEDDIADSDLEKMEGKEVETETYVWRDPIGHLEDKEWDFDHFRKQKMRAWMGESHTSYDEDVEVDEGFADVDAAVAAEKVDPMGGRGVNGVIGHELNAALANGTKTLN
jgi:Gamma-glutamyl cyclotransferase, AIG2-like